jgi:hypothetical protein
LLDLKWLAIANNAYTMLMDINANINGNDKANLLDLKWLAREENAHLLKYYLD